MNMLGQIGSLDTCSDYRDWHQPWTAPPLYYIPPVTYPPVTYITTTAAPRECAGDVHVFACPHCDKCKCGQAIKVKSKEE